MIGYWRCTKCHETLYRLMLKAMIEDLGVQVSPSATACSAGGKHDFEQVEVASKEDLPWNRAKAAKEAANANGA